MRVFLIILAALMVAAGSGYYLLQTAAPAAAPVATAEPAAAPVPKQVYVPAASLAAGTILLPEHLTRMPLERGAVTDEMIVADDDGRELLIGSVARHALPRGVPIARSAIVHPGERGFLAAVLPQGKRAISIPIGEVAGLSGLVMPGDRVDIILTYSILGSVIDAGRDVRASETVLANLRVLALDQRLQGSETGENGRDRPIARTATLEVTPQQAEMLTLATQLGELSLVLNSIADGGEPAAVQVADLTAIAAVVAGEEDLPDRRAFTLDSQVTSLLRREASQEAAEDAATGDRQTHVQIVRGIQSQGFSFPRGTEAPADPEPAEEPAAATVPAAAVADDPPID